MGACRHCSLTWENPKTALANARAHHSTSGHTTEIVIQERYIFEGRAQRR